MAMQEPVNAVQRAVSRCIAPLRLIGRQRRDARRFDALAAAVLRQQHADQTRTVEEVAHTQRSTRDQS